MNPVSLSDDDRQAFETAQARLRAILPEEYQDSYEDIQPVSMGSAGLKYTDDGTVAWDEMWDSFCDLAMAGGPPHKGTLLEPAPTDVEAQPDRYSEVVDEICRGITLVTDLERTAPIPGWIRVELLQRGDGRVAPSRHRDGERRRRAPRQTLDFRPRRIFASRRKSRTSSPSSPRPATTGWGTCRSHSADDRELFAAMATESPLMEPAPSDDGAPRAARASAALRTLDATLASTSEHRYAGWLGVECPSVRAAVWMMRPWSRATCCRDEKAPCYSFRSIRAPIPKAGRSPQALGPRPSLRRGQRRPLTITRARRVAVQATRPSSAKAGSIASSATPGSGRAAAPPAPAAADRTSTGSRGRPGEALMSSTREPQPPNAPRAEKPSETAHPRPGVW